MMKRSRLNPAAANTIRLAALERVQQLKRISSNLNVITKQIELLEVADAIILRANGAPKGLVEVVFTDKVFKEGTPVSRILLNSQYKISAFNVSDPEEYGSLYRTVIIVDPVWSDSFTVYQSEYGLPVDHLKKIRHDYT